MSIDNLISELTDEGIKKPLPNPYMQTLYWFIPTSLFMAAVMYYFGFRPDIQAKMNDGIYIVELFFLAVTIFSFVVTAFYYSRPDTYQRPWMIWVSFILLPMPLITGYLGASDLMTIEGFMTSLHNHMGMKCATCVTLFTIPPIIALFTMLRLGASVYPAKTGLLATIGSTVLSYTLMRLHEPNDNPAHILIWHIFPLISIASLGVIAGYFLLKWKK